MPFNDGRRGLRLVSCAFAGRATVPELAFEAERPVEGVTLMLPYVFRGRALWPAAVDGATRPVVSQLLEGRRQVLPTADYAAGQRRDWRLEWGQRP